jgi:hypothetical protein
VLLLGVRRPQQVPVPVVQQPALEEDYRRPALRLLPTRRRLALTR